MQTRRLQSPIPPSQCRTWTLLGHAEPSPSCKPSCRFAPIAALRVVVRFRTRFVGSLSMASAILHHTSARPQPLSMHATQQASALTPHAPEIRGVHSQSSGLLEPRPHLAWRAGGVRGPVDARDLQQLQPDGAAAAARVLGRLPGAPQQQPAERDGRQRHPAGACQPAAAAAGAPSSLLQRAASSLQRRRACSQLWHILHPLSTKPSRASWMSGLSPVAPQREAREVSGSAGTSCKSCRTAGRGAGMPSTCCALGMSCNGLKQRGFVLQGRCALQAARHLCDGCWMVCRDGGTGEGCWGGMTRCTACC